MPPKAATTTTPGELDLGNDTSMAEVLEDL